MKEFLLLASLLLLQGKLYGRQPMADYTPILKDGGLHGTISEIKTQYITIPGTVVLSCQYENIPTLTWRQRNFIISQDSTINPAFNGSERFRATIKQKDKQYELQILNTTEEDLGLYVCDAQLNSTTTETKVILRLADFIISTEENIMSTMFIDNHQSTTFISEDDTTFVSEEKSTFVSEEKSTGLTYRETTSERQSTIANKDYEEEEENTKEDTGLSFREMFFYGLLAAGLALVLFFSVLCHFCLNRKRKKESSPILKSPLQIMEENVLNDNQRISLVEMDEISLYELINENQMLSNLALAMQSNGRTVACQLKRSQSTSSTTSSEKSYSEIVDDNAYLNPYQPMKSDRESSNLHKYSTTSNTEKSLQKPQWDDVDEVTIANQNTSSTLLEADVVNLSDHDDDTDGIIDKGDGYLHPYVPLDSNDMESLKNNYAPIKKYKDNMSSKIECSTENEDEVMCEDGYLHPYVPLMTNCMEYLHSYSSPINHNQLMKNNKSLTSSPCDDMDKVPIAEQKTKDSVGKENTMNLSDHESSESDGDTDAMCGNEDGYLHPYVPLMTNCMEYLHSYSTPNINENQLMKTKSSKLKDNEHCESVMNITNDEDCTDDLSSNVISS